MDCYHVFGEDLLLDDTNDIRLDFQPVEGTQRLLRRLLTNQGEYIWHPDYGAGLGSYIGKNITDREIEEIKNTITSQIFQEEFVAKNPSPIINVIPSYNTIDCVIKYYNLELEKYELLSFTVT